MGRRALRQPKQRLSSGLRLRLRDGLREASLLGDGACWGWLMFPISTTVGGWGLASYCSSFGQSGFYRDAGVWTLGARQ